VKDDEQIWALFQNDFPVQLTAAGKGDRLYAIRIGFPIVNVREEQKEQAFALLSRLFERTYGGSSGMSEWPERSLGQAWQARVGPDGNQLVWDPATALVRTERNGVISATFGTPPDFVVYLVTAREECIPPPVFGELVNRVVC
jgi:hypothetical protein